MDMSKHMVPEASRTFSFKRVDANRLRPSVFVPKQDGATVQLVKYGNDPRDTYILTRFAKRNAQPGKWSHNAKTAAKVRRRPAYAISTVGR